MRRFEQEQLDWFNSSIKTDTIARNVPAFKTYRVAVVMAVSVMFFKCGPVMGKVKAPVKTTQHVPSTKDTVTKHLIKYVKITGRVSDTTDSALLPGATVMVKGTKIVTSTDSEGYFKLFIPDTTSAIEFHYVGYESQVVKIDVLDKYEYNVSLKLKETRLDQIAVIGYGTRTVTTLMGAISVVRKRSFWYRLWHWIIYPFKVVF